VHVLDVTFAVVMFIVRAAVFLCNWLRDRSPSPVYVPSILLLSDPRALTAYFGRVIAFRHV